MRNIHKETIMASYITNDEGTNPLPLSAKFSWLMKPNQNTSKWYIMKGKIITHPVEQHHEKDCQHDQKKNLYFIYMQFYLFKSPRESWDQHEDEWYLY